MNECRIIMKRTMAICGAAMLLAGCGKESKKEIRIGFLVKRPEEKWFQQEWESAQRAANANGFKLIKIGVPDGEKLLAAIDNLAAQQALGFVVCTPDVRLGPAIVAKAKQQGMKVIAVDDQFIGADGKPMEDVPFMGMAGKKIGEQVGNTLAAEMKNRGWRVEDTGAVQISFDELETCRDRNGGAAEALIAAGFPKEQIYPAPQTTTDVPGGFDAANVLLTKHAGVKHWLAFGCNDEAVLGTVRALEGRGYGVDDVIAVGIGGDTVLTDLQKEKPTGVVGSILCSSRRHGYETATMMFHWIKDGVKPPATTFTSGTLLTRENYRQVIQEQEQKSGGR